jgi:hypothetical protein
MALKYGRTKNTTTPTPTYGLEGLKRDESVSLTNPKNLDENGRVQMYPKPASRIAGEQIVAEQDKAYRGYLSQKTEAESEYNKGTEKYGEDMKKYSKNKANFGGKQLDQGFVPISKENLALFNDVQSRSGTGELPKSQVKVYKGTEAKFIADMQKHDKLGSKDPYGNTPFNGSNYFGARYFDKDVKPVKPLMKKVASVNAPTELEPWNLAVNPIEKIKAKGGKLKQAKVAPEEWTAPELRGRSKTKATKLTSTDDGTRIGRFNGMTVGKTKPNRLEYNREKKTSAAYFGDNVLEGSVTGKNAAELKEMKKATKQTRNEVLADGGIKNAISLQKEVKQLRRAGEYAKKGDISKQYGTGKIIEGRNSKLDYFTAEGTKGVNNERGITERAPGAMAGYKEDQAYKKQQAFSSSMSNMANRNTVAKQNAALSGSDTYVGSPMAQAKATLRTANPDMSNKEVRQGARKQRVEDKNIMKIQSERMKNK